MKHQRLDFSCESSAKQLKHQASFALKKIKIKKKYLLMSAAVVIGTLRVRLAGDHLFGKLLFTWLSLVVSMVMSFCAVLFPTRCLG